MKKIKKLSKESIIKKGGIGALKIAIKEELKNLIREQGGGPIPRYRIDAGGCIQCPTGVGPNNCPYLDKECTVHYSDNYSGGVGHPGGNDGGDGNDDGGNGNDNGTYNCINNACVKVIGKGGVGQYATEDECMNSGCGESPRSGGNIGTDIKGTSAMHKKHKGSNMPKHKRPNYVHPSTSNIKEQILKLLNKK